MLAKIKTLTALPLKRFSTLIEEQTGLSALSTNKIDLAKYKLSSISN